MRPTSDDIARVIVKTSGAAGVHPLKTYAGMFGGVVGGRVGKARAATCFCLAGTWGREAQDWAVWMGWKANVSAAIDTLARHRNRDILHSPIVHAGAVALGLDPRTPLEHDKAINSAKLAAKRERMDAARKNRKVREAEAACERTAAVARESLADVFEKAERDYEERTARVARMRQHQAEDKRVLSQPATLEAPIMEERPAPSFNPGTEAEAMRRLLDGIPAKRGIQKTCEQRGW